MYDWKGEVGQKMRILKTELEYEIKRKVNITVLYGPNDDEKVAIKGTFWVNTTDIIESLKGVKSGTESWKHKKCYRKTWRKWRKQ